MRGDDGAAVTDEGLARVAQAARLSLARAAPALSARRRIWFSQILFACAGVSAAFTFALVDARLAAQSAHAFGFGIFAILTATRLVAAAAALAPPRARAVTWTGDLPVYTILCPLYREAQMLPAIVERMSRLDYPGVMAHLPQEPVKNPFRMTGVC